MKKLLLLTSVIVYQISAMDWTRNPVTGEPSATPGAEVQRRTYQILEDANGIKARLTAAGYADIANKTNLASKLANKNTNPEAVIAIVKETVPADSATQIQIAKIVAPDQTMAFERMEKMQQNLANFNKMWR